MSTYDPPNEIPLPPVFNPINFVSDNGMGISQATADLRYLKKGGDTATGVINFSSGILTNDGSNLSAPIGFINQANTGVYRIGGSNLGITVGSVKQLDFTSSLATFTNPIQVPATTTLTNCGLQVGLANTGLQYNAGILYFGLGGTQMMRFQAAQIYSSQPHNFTNGSTASPSVCASSFQTTGLSWAAGNILNFSTSAVRRGFFNTTGFSIGDLGDAVARKNFGTYTFTAPNLPQHGTTNTTITYTNAFASTPRIYLTTSFNSATSTYMYGVLASASDIGTTTFKINICNLVNNSTTGDITVNWIAEL